MPKRTANRRTRGGFWPFSSEKPKEELTSVVPSTSTSEPKLDNPKSSWFGNLFGKPANAEGQAPADAAVSAPVPSSNVDVAPPAPVGVPAEPAKIGGGRRRKTVKRKRNQNKSKGKNKKR